jgi:hypothetical protein
MQRKLLQPTFIFGVVNFAQHPEANEITKGDTSRGAATQALRFWMDLPPLLRC